MKRSKITIDDDVKESIKSSFKKVKDIKLPFIKDNRCTTKVLPEINSNLKSSNNDLKLNSKILRPNKSFIANLFRYL